MRMMITMMYSEIWEEARRWKMESEEYMNRKSRHSREERQRLVYSLTSPSPSQARKWKYYRPVAIMTSCSDMAR